MASSGLIDHRDCCFYTPPGLGKYKSGLFARVGAQMGHKTSDHRELPLLPPDIIPIIGCMINLKPYIDEWKRTGREFIYWDRGYMRRIFATWLPRGENGGYYRWTRNAFQMQSIRDVPSERWDSLKLPVVPWRKSGRKIVVASTLSDYWQLHGCLNWVQETAAYLRTITDRPVVIRDKDTKTPLRDELADAHILVAHGSIAAIEAVIMGCPVCVHPSCAASLVGITDLSQIEHPIYPDRQAWLNSLAYSQYNEAELVDGTLWKWLQ